MKLEWHPEDRYLSNNGSGPMMARILRATDKIVTLEKWNTKSKRPRRDSFPLSVAFFTSPRCGWKKVKAHAEPLTVEQLDVLQFGRVLHTRS